MKNFYRYTGLLVLGAMFSATLFDAEARADVAPAPVLAQPAKILEQKPVVDCSKSTITGEQLLDMAI
jgi:hypothetical protein